MLNNNNRPQPPLWFSNCCGLVILVGIVLLLITLWEQTETFIWANHCTSKEYRCMFRADYSVSQIEYSRRVNKMMEQVGREMDKLNEKIINNTKLSS